MKQPAQDDSTLTKEAQRDIHRAALDPLGKSLEDLVKHAQEFVADANQRITQLKNEDQDDEVLLSDFDFDTEEGRLAFRTRMKQVSDLRLAAAKRRLIAARMIREDGSAVSDDEIHPTAFDLDTEKGCHAFMDRLIEVGNRRLAAVKQRFIKMGLIREDGSKIDDVPLPESGGPIIVVHEGLEAHGLSLTQAEYDEGWRIIIFDGRPMKRCSNERMKRALLGQ